MSIGLYDQALYDLVTGWLGENKTRVLRPSETSELFRINADINKDQVLTLPLIAISRNTDIEILQTKKTLLSFDGKILKVSKDSKSSIQLNAIPIQLGYQLDIYAKDVDEAYEYVREFVFAFINNPVIKITIPYNGTNIVHQANIRMQSTISDNSDIPERLFRDQFTRVTLQLDLNDAYLFSTPVRENARIVAGDLDIVKPGTNTIEHSEKLYTK